MAYNKKQPYNDLPDLPPDFDFNHPAILKNLVKAFRQLGELKGAEPFRMIHLKRNGFLAFYLLSSLVAMTQNMVLNHSFEEVKFLHEGPLWKTTHGTEFTEMSVAWLSPHSSSPDYLDHESKQTYIFKEYNVKLRNYRAVDGNKHVGISVYGCHRKSGACREYVQTQLSQPLEIGKKYYVEFWVSRIRNGAIINNLGALFSQEPPTSIHIELVGYIPQVLYNNSIGETPFKWEKISGTFTADSTYQYLTIGNFFEDKQTQLYGADTSALSLAYYFLDNVKVEALDETEKGEFSDNLEFGKKYTLEDVYFAFADTIILKESFFTLKKLLSFMITHSESRIEILGHTDSKGEKEYNLALSKRRSETIREFLIKHGIDGERIVTKGLGDSQPVATNQTEAGRKKNRRIEVKIIK